MAEASDTASATAEQREKSPKTLILSGSLISQVGTARDSAETVCRFARCVHELATYYRDRSPLKFNDPLANLHAMAEQAWNLADQALNDAVKVYDAIDAAVDVPLESLR